MVKCLLISHKLLFAFPSNYSVKREREMAPFFELLNYIVFLSIQANVIF